MHFLHVADLHLDSPLRGLESYEGAPVVEIREATRRACENLVSAACERRVDFVVIAGDVFDGDRDDYGSALFLYKQLTRLKGAGIPVFMIAGNHDAASKMSKTLTWPDNVRVLSVKAPETIDLPELGVAIHGQGFAKSAEPRNLAANYPPPLPDRFNLGLLHTSLDGREGHEPYAPCKTSELVDKGYDYWALGHVHAREVVGESPWIVFPGNVQGRHIREPGAKGGYFVEVDARGRAKLEFVPLDVLRWEIARVSAVDCERPEQLLAAASEAIERITAQSPEHLWAIRVEVIGATALHAMLHADPTRWSAEIRARGQGASGDRAWIEKVKFMTEPLERHVAALDEDGPLAELAALFQELRTNDDALQELGQELAELRGKLPAELDDRDDAAPVAAEALRRLLEEAEPFLFARLGGRRGDA